MFMCVLLFDLLWPLHSLIWMYTYFCSCVCFHSTCYNTNLFFYLNVCGFLHFGPRLEFNTLKATMVDFERAYYFWEWHRWWYDDRLRFSIILWFNFNACVSTRTKSIANIGVGVEKDLLQAQLRFNQKFWLPHNR
jgi:hypothetical protein